MFNIRKYETYAWDAANNISKEQVEEFIKLLQYQLDLKPIVVEHKSDLLFEIADKSTEKKMDWNDAVEYVKSLGEGWRLPTKDELNQIYNSKNDFKKWIYWSSTENDGLTWNQDFNLGYQGNYYKNDGGLYVRAIRDIK